MSNSTDKELADVKSKIINGLMVFDLSPEDLDKYNKAAFWAICESAINQLINKEVVAELKSIHAKSDTKGTLYNETDRLIDERISALTKKGHNSGKDN